METITLSKNARAKFEAIKHLCEHPNYPKRRIAARFERSLPGEGKKECKRNRYKIIYSKIRNFQ